MKQMTCMACAAMLASAIAFTGCNSNDPSDPQNVQNVATDITIALPAQVSGGAHKMPSATVQESGISDFETNGMKNIVLVPFAKSIDVIGTSTRFGSNILLGDIAGTETTSYTPDAHGRTKVFENKPVPAGTGTFLFYAESGATATGDDANFKTGKLSADYSSANPKDYEFYLSPIQENATTVTGNAAYIGLIAYMNSVAQAEASSVQWRNYADNTAGLVDLFNLFKTAKVLSSYGVARMMTDLYNTLEPLATGGDEMATAIRTAIANTTTYVDMAGNVVTLKSTYAGFPESLNLPVGALSVAWDGDAKEFKGNADGSAVTSFSVNPANVNQYTYPASLWYYAESKIKTSTASEKEHYAGAADWSAILGQYPNDNATVNSGTRSIALKSEVQYGVARLDIRLKAAETLADNNTNTAANQITNTEGYELTGVLVGGQKSVGFDFTPATYPTGGTHDKIYTIYDKVMGATVKASTSDYSTAKNSTLVLETAADEDVYIAIELLNNSGKDFYGVDHQLIPAGGKFYLVGKLNATNSGDPADPKKTDVTASVFKQDYTTTAKLTIGDLKSAYNTIPDLKAPSVEIGFSVNLEWTAGNVYEVTL